MASTLCQKWLLRTRFFFFCQKAQKFVYFGPYDFVQISLVCGTNSFKGMYGETLDFQCQHYHYSNGSTEEF